MRKNISLLILILVYFSCKDEQRSEGVIFEAYEDNLLVDKEIHIITHGDTPVWYNKTMDEIQFLLKGINSIPQESIVISGMTLVSFEADEIVNQFQMNELKSESEDISIFTSKNLELIIENEDLNSIRLNPNENSSINGISVSKFNLADAKKYFPESYALRNYYGDNFRARLYELKFEYYDHLVLNISNTDFFVHLRFIDSKLKDIEINKRGI